MSRRALGALILASAWLTLVAVDSARACGPSRWVYDPVDLTACVGVSYVSEGTFEFVNDCPEPLTLAAPDCDHCTLPSSVPSGESGLLELDPAPERRADRVVDLNWGTGDTSGMLAFTYGGTCPEGRSCVAAPGPAPRWSWAPLTALALVVVVRRRSRNPR